MVAWTVGVVVATFGSREWSIRGDKLAQKKIDEGVNCIHVHGSTLSEARNIGALYIDTDYVVFLDADDDLASGYTEAMAAAIDPNWPFDAILQPSTQGRVDGVLDDFPLLIPQANLYQRNYLVIGSAVCRTDFLHIGGFRELPCLEDWDCWIRLIISGASVKRVPDAVYIVNVMPNGRNSQSMLHGQIYHQLQQEYAQHADTLRQHRYI